MSTKLLIAIKEALPFYVYPTKRLCAQLKESSNINISPKSKLEVEDVMDGGHEGGILCVVKFEENRLFVSLTHVEVAGGFVLKNEIVKYQTERIRELKAEHYFNMYVNGGSTIGRNAPCPCGSGKKYKKCCMEK